jgi:predicted RNA polymerase sigma factor
MEIQASRLKARVGPGGEPILLLDQDRARWDRLLIRRGLAALYDALAQLAPSPIVELNRAVAVGMALGPAAGLEIVDPLRDEPALQAYHLLPSVRGDLLLKLGRANEAVGVRARRLADAERARAGPSSPARRREHVRPRARRPRR